MAHEKRVVIAFGRFNPPTTGHEALVTFLTQTAHRMGAEARVYPSPTTDAKKNPLPFREKVGFLRQLFPHVTINDNPAMNTPFAAFADASAAGYKDITVIVGADRVRDFESFAAYLLPANSPKYNAAKHIDVSHYRVLAIPRGIGAMSATLMRGYVIANDFPSFLAGTPGKNVAVAKKLFASLRQHMHIREQQDYRNAMRQKVQEAEVASSLKKQGRLLDEGKDYSMVVVDPDGGSPSWKRGGHGHTPVPKVVWQMHSLDASDLKHAVELAHKAHPKLNVSIEKRKKYEALLHNVAFLEALSNYDRMTIAEALVTTEYHRDDPIISFGERGQWMHIIVEGTVEVFGRDPDTNAPVSICTFGPGKCIGELEFINAHDAVHVTYVVRGTGRGEIGSGRCQLLETECC